MAFSKDGINWLKHDQNIIDDILNTGHIQKDDLTIVVIDGKN